jgi:2-polyprenyl-3-methyl-5-hydroxy-6-metoxy-1,4-benzoquinol methylase
VSHTNTNKGIINGLYQAIKKRTIRKKGRQIFKQSGKKTGNILDYGCGTGTFLAHMKSLGWNIFGLEPSPAARKVAQNEYGLNLQPIENLWNLPPKSVDVITLWHVLEHVHRLNDTLEQLTQILKDDGLLVIAVPNVTAWDAQHYQQFWAAYDVPRHLYHFTIETMEQLLANHQLVVEDKKLMPFDSFYVSMLSEKYKNGGLGIGGLFRAFINGLRSNMNAVSDLHYASSITYWIRKKA